MACGHVLATLLTSAVFFAKLARVVCQQSHVREDIDVRAKPGRNLLVTLRARGFEQEVSRACVLAATLVYRCFLRVWEWEGFTIARATSRDAW